VATSRRPSEVGLVQDFVNTLDLESGADEIGSPRALGRWLATHGLLSASQLVAPRDHRTALLLREALRSSLRAHTGAPIPEARAEEIDVVAARLPLRVGFDSMGDARLRPAPGGVPGALAAILAEVARAVETGSWSRLKACSAERCQWVFYDRSRNRSGRWCSMRVCGNRHKTRRYRRRRAPHAARLGSPH
jgi:predicted RNA-binding Zn ribbon-like protein